MTKTTSSWQIKPKGKSRPVISITGSYEAAKRAAKALLECDRDICTVEVTGAGKREVFEL